MWIQSSIKHVLTQGDSILVAWWTTIHEQGVYALAANYGSLVARMLFQPLEESSRNLFAKLLSQKDKDGRPDSEALASAAKILKIMIKLYLLLSIFATVLGPPFAPVGLKLVAGSRWGESAAGDVLAIYCYYIPLLAINGITEAFVQSVATSNELHAQSVWMFSFSLGFGIAGYLFVRTLGLGAEGLVWANVVNMVLRIAWSSVFIQRYFKKNGLKPGWAESLPSGTLAAVAVALGAAVRGYGTGGRLPRVAEVGLVHQLGFATVGGGVLLVAW
jgi:oligosaccharide translocation protein RFT1